MIAKLYFIQGKQVIVQSARITGPLTLDIVLDQLVTKYAYEKNFVGATIWDSNKKPAATIRRNAK